MKHLEETMREEFPNVKEYDTRLYESYLHHRMIMEEIAENIAIPLEELIDFFYKGKIQKDLIEREEMEYVSRQKSNLLREMPQDNGRE